MTDKLDIVGIGNAMVDAIIPSDKDEVEKNNLNRDSMNLIDEELKNSLHNNYSIKEMAGGGSLGNSMFGITSFGGNGSFIGKIKNDEVGIFLQKDMVREGLQFPLVLLHLIFQLVVALFLLKMMEREPCVLF
jgi:sugar/nucleoside kinase (ribokinase family)